MSLHLTQIFSLHEHINVLEKRILYTFYTRVSRSRLKYSRFVRDSALSLIVDFANVDLRVNACVICYSNKISFRTDDILRSIVMTSICVSIRCLESFWSVLVKFFDLISCFVCSSISWRLKISSLLRWISFHSILRRHNMLTNRVRARTRSHIVNYFRRNMHFVTCFDNWSLTFEIACFVTNSAEI